MSSTSPTPVAAGPAEATFLAALAAGLPAAEAWASPSLIAVSGGADSVALLLGLLRLVPAAAGPRPVVIHADHGLRADSAADAAFVGDLAAAHDLRFITRRLDVVGDAGSEGLEGRARRLRYAFLAEAAHEAGARHVLVAHTADDQAETILHRLLRGTGVAGLAGMRRSRRLADGVALLRPLLHVSRASVRAFLAAVGQDWREDATNADLRHARNFLRHEILPRCEAGPYPAATEAIVRLGGQAAAAAAVIEAAAERLLAEHAAWPPDGTVVLRRRPLGELDPHLVAEIFVTIWRRLNWPRRDMTAAHFASLARLAQPSTPGGTVRQFPGGITASVRGPDLVLTGS